jgi:hypothetical protein
VSGLKPLRVKPGTTAQFEVQTKNPVREVKWYKNGNLLQNPQTEQPDGTHFRLIIPNASLDDQGDYKVNIFYKKDYLLFLLDNVIYTYK